MANNLFIRQLHTLPTMKWQVVDESGCPVSLLNTSYGDAIGVTFTLAKQDRKMTPVLIDAPAIITDASKGMLEYNWTSFDTMFLFDYYALFSVTFRSVPIPATQSSFTYETVQYKSVSLNSELNNVVVIFNGVKTIAQVISDFNAASSENITSDAPDDSVVPTAASLTFTGGADEVFIDSKIGFPTQKEELTVTVDATHSINPSGIICPPTSSVLPPSGEVADWLQERLRTDFALIGAKDGVNRIFSVSPNYFTVNEAFNIKVFHNGIKLTRGIDFNVASTDISKMGYNQIIFEADAAIPFDNGIDPELLTADFYISDKD